MSSLPPLPASLAQVLASRPQARKRRAALGWALAGQRWALLRTAPLLLEQHSPAAHPPSQKRAEERSRAHKHPVLKHRSKGRLSRRRVYNMRV